MRSSKVKRETKETKIQVKIDLEGSGESNIDTGIPFFDHMLESLSKHGGFDLEIEARGDIEVDFHHTIEDTGIVLGEALKKAVDKEKINRFGSASIPMDEALTQVSLDFSGRSYFVSNFPNKSVSGIDLGVFDHFFKSLSDNAGITLHIETNGKDPHHIVESSFKAFAVSLKEAVGEERKKPKSTKGML